MLTLLIIFIWLLGSFASYAFASRVVPFLTGDEWSDLDRKFASALSILTSWGLLIILVFIVVLVYIGRTVGNCPPLKANIYNFLKMLEPKKK